MHTHRVRLAPSVSSNRARVVPVGSISRVGPLHRWRVDESCNLRVEFVIGTGDDSSVDCGRTVEKVKVTVRSHVAVHDQIIDPETIHPTVVVDEVSIVEDLASSEFKSANGFNLPEWFASIQHRIVIPVDISNSPDLYRRHIVVDLLEVNDSGNVLTDSGDCAILDHFDISSRRPFAGSLHIGELLRYPEWAPY